MFAVGNDCADCVRTPAEGYPELTYDAVKDRVKTSDKFKVNFTKANRVRTGLKPRRFRRQQVDTTSTSGYTTERWYMFLSVDEFFKAAGKTQAAAGIPVDKLCDEGGHPTSGALLTETGRPHGYRRARACHPVTDVGIAETFSDPRTQLRANQGADFYADQGQAAEASYTPHTEVDADSGSAAMAASLVAASSIAGSFSQRKGR